MTALPLLSMVYASLNVSIGPLTVIGRDIELEGRGVLDLQNTSDQEALFTVLYDVCDRYNTCNKSLSVPDHLQTFLHCCVPCDCSDDCFLMGNCCRDKVGEPRRANSGQIVSENGEVCSMVNPIDEMDMAHSYLLVTECHPEYQGEARDRCVKPNGTTLDELTPVYSEQTGLSYFNIHCAICNYQIHSPTPWDVKVACDTYAPLRHLPNIDPSFQNCCHFQWLPNNQNTQCYTKTGSDDCVGARYQTLCDSVPESYGYVKALEERACTCGLPLKYNSICLPDTNVNHGFDYAALLNWNVDVALDVAETTATCPEGKRFNNVERKCLRLTCSPSQISVNVKDNHCIDLYAAVVGLCLDYRLRVTTTTADAASFYLANLAMREVNNAIFKDRPPTPPLETDVIDYSEANGSVTYNIRVVEILESFTDIPRMFRQFEDTLLQYGTTRSDIRIEPAKAGLAFMPQPLEEIAYLSYDNNLTANGCHKTVAMSDFQFCEMVMFSPEEYRIRGGVVVVSGGWEFHPHEYVFRDSRDGTRHVQVCLETYLWRKNVINSGSPVTAVDIPKLISLTCFLLHFLFQP